MGHIPGVEPKNAMKTVQGHSLRYFLVSLAGIAQALEDLGYRDEAGRLHGVKQDLETKSPPGRKE